MYKNFLKRLLDIAGSVLVLPMVLLLIIILGPIIYFTDKGPIFYNADRMGRNCKIFKMYKFRSMKVNAPDVRNADGSTFNSNDDPRLTKIGAFIRKTSLDEFPQFLNVLFGDMSFVGPRPTLVPKDMNFNHIKRKRLEVRPGITGYSQAYYRNSITQEEKFNYDCFYVSNISLVLDIKILFKTIYSVFNKKSIYNN